jgi:hypothetical protein
LIYKCEFESESNIFILQQSFKIMIIYE